MNSKKKILIFIDWFTPGYKAGGPVSSVVNLIENLSQEFEFMIITTDCEYLETLPYSNIESDKWTDFNENVKIFYAKKTELSVKKIKKVVENIEFDTAYINGIYSFYFSILPLYILKNKQKKIIVASRGMLSSQAFTAKSFKKKLYLNTVKFLGLYKNCIFQATNIEEAKEIEALKLGMKEIIIVSNLSKKIINDSIIKTEKIKGKLALVSIARISKEKNTKFALEVLTNYKYEGEIIFDLYGSIYDKSFWEECLEIIKNLPKNIIVNYCDTIESNKVLETFSKYHFSFMPSAGENFGHSLLESMIAGTPIITSQNTPWRNLEQKNAGWDIELENKEMFSEIIQKCIDLQDFEYFEMSKKTFDFAKENSNNIETINKTKQLFS